MKRTNLRVLTLIAFLLPLSSPTLDAQHHGGGIAVSHRGDRDAKADDEFSMSHFDAFAGELIGLVLPKRILDLPVSKGWWEAVESEKVKIVEHSPTSASVRLLKSGTTVVNFKYKIMREGREVSESYPFTIRIHRVDPEAVQVPSSIYVGWDMSQNLQEHIHLLPKYSESSVILSLEDPRIADIDEGYDGMRITGRKVGETTLHVETASGLHADMRVVVEVPELKSIDIKASEKTLRLGDIMPLQLKIWPLRSQAYVTWSSDNPDIVSVNQDGVVTAESEGKTTIRVVADNGVKDSITLKVKKK